MGWARIGKVFIVALVLDILYQVIVLDVYPGEAIIVAFLLQSFLMSFCAAL